MIILNEIQLILIVYAEHNVKLKSSLSVWSCYFFLSENPFQQETNKSKDKVQYISKQ